MRLMSGLLLPQGIRCGRLFLKKFHIFSLSVRFF
uniref:Uncharacterized protein n=1 Tax=Anguilla anguilla TaxID=7936 RepID=A0A0E9UA03_ANGAN